MRCFTLFLGLVFCSYGAAAPATLPALAGHSAAGHSFNPVFSAEGRHLVFVSQANNLVANDNLDLWLDVFVRDLASSNTVLVSVNTNGLGGANSDANYPSISSNGGFVAFASRASNLVSNDTNGESDVFIRNLNTGVTRLVSVDVDGHAPLSPVPFFSTDSSIALSGNPQISADGRWVFFESRATNLITGGVPFDRDRIYVRDMELGVTTLVSFDQSNNVVTGRCALSSITPNSRYVAFTATRPFSIASEAYIRDRQLGRTFWLSTNLSTIIPNGYRCLNPVLSDDGNFAAFTAISLDTARQYVLRHDLQTGATTVLSSNAANASHGVQISADGNHVLFEESTNGVAKVQLWNSTTGANLNIGCDLGGEARNASMTPDAAHVVFVACSNLYVMNVASGTNVLVSADTNGAALNKDFALTFPVIRAEGAFVSFEHTASEIFEGDLNEASDILLRDVNAGRTELVSKAVPAKPAATSFTHSLLGLNSVSADGRFILSMRFDDPSTYRDTNGSPDVYVSDLLNNSNEAVSIFQNTNPVRAPIISQNGNVLAALWLFPSLPSALTAVVVAEKTNGDFGSNGFVLASRAVGGPSASATCDSPSLSADGSLLAFRSDDPFQSVDVWLRFAGTNYLLSKAYNSQTTANGPSMSPSVNSAGDVVLFASKAGNLIVPGNPTTSYQIFAALPGINRTETNYLVKVPKRLCSYSSISFQEYMWTNFFDSSERRTNVNAVFTPHGTDTTNALLSADSRYAFYSIASERTVWRHDLTTVHTNITPVQMLGGRAVVITNLVAGASNILACTNCRNVSVSSNGAAVTFERVRAGSTMVDLFAKAVESHEETMVSANPSGTAANHSSLSPLMSADGRYVVFQSKASDLVPNDTNGVSDIFVRDRFLGVTMLVSANLQGHSGNGPSTLPIMAADGRTVVFQSLASDLVTGDYNDKRDIFVLTLGGADTDGDGMDDDWEVTYFNNKSRDGANDFDGDGASDLQEFLAGTDPTDGNSFFRVLTVAPAGGGSKLLFWSGNPDRSYRAEFKDDLAAESWTPLTGAISWNGFTASITDSGAGGSTNRYYRVGRLP